jgi:hypothetical protein
MKSLARITVAAALLLGGSSLATAKIRAVHASHGKPFRPDINEATSRPTVADPYYRLSEQYYGYADPYRGYYDYHAVLPYIPGYSYGYVTPGGWR